jgi:hypothetical protein
MTRNCIGHALTIHERLGYDEDCNIIAPCLVYRDIYIHPWREVRLLDFMLDERMIWFCDFHDWSLDYALCVTGPSLQSEM